MRLKKKVKLHFQQKKLVKSHQNSKFAMILNFNNPLFWLTLKLYVITFVFLYLGALACLIHLQVRWNLIGEPAAARQDYSSQTDRQPFLDLDAADQQER